MHTFYIDFRKCTLHTFIPLDIFGDLEIFQHVLKVTINPGVIISYGVITGL